MTEDLANAASNAIDTILFTDGMPAPWDDVAERAIRDMTNDPARDWSTIFTTRGFSCEDDDRAHCWLTCADAVDGVAR